MEQCAEFGEHVKRKGLRELFGCTATAFECEAPAVAGLPYDEMLRAYARFTAVQVEQALARGAGLPEVRCRLYTAAYRMGEELRRTFGITKTAEALATVELLYRALGITLHVELRGGSTAEVTVRRCLFSEYYSASVCQLVASLDDGLFSGLSGGRLEFHRRITEGDGYCTASFRMQGGL
jgi:hypothetical protein